jgi:hypothetical protein
MHTQDGREGREVQRLRTNTLAFSAYAWGPHGQT